MEISVAEALRSGMRRLASGVSVLSTEAEGRRFAMTVSSVTSLSDAPASLLVCVNRETDLHDMLGTGQAFAINVLSQQQQQESNVCAQQGLREERFKVGNWQVNETNTPFLTDSQAIFFCKVMPESFSFGTHKVVVGAIDQVITADGPIDPLVYVDGGYATTSPLK